MSSKIIYFSAILCLLIGSSCLAREYTMENTVLKDGIRYDMEGRTLDGTVVVYYPSGELLLEMPYKDGKFHGIARGYMKEGPLFMEILYENGKEIKTKAYYKTMHQKA